MRPDPELRKHLQALGHCRLCPDVVAPPVYGLPVRSPVMLIGQAPGIREQQTLRPFAWTAGKRLFGWFESIGLPESAFRTRVYMTAVARCFPGKNPRGGDRVPSRQEIANCGTWLKTEFELLRPRLVIPVGKLAIHALLGPGRLDATVGTLHRRQIADAAADVVPLPHPSGASTWIHTEPGKTLLRRALQLLAQHPDWRAMQGDRVQG
ncbi:MAG: uracil-DNA glycosylase family protein [Gammaproteobacteria bacterium]|nr:uracil-DNA glycosylase family protein [Gammaproteobacteria bacterium]